MKVWEAIFVTAIGTALAQEQAAPPLTEEQRKAQEILRQKVEERQKKAAAAAAQTNAEVRLTQAEMEQQYLAGKITAKQFQQYLKQQPSTMRMSPEKQDQAVQMLRALTGKTNAPNVAGKAAPESGDAPAEPATPAIVDVEAKIRELEKLKEAREKGTNAPATATPKTKREKLDALLKQYVEGKISEPDYKAQRAKLIAEPD